MLGAIIGDIVGSTYEFNGVKNKDFELFPLGSNFTDDTVLTIATADAILNSKFYLDVYRHYPRNYPGRGYGGRFSGWYKGNDIKPYNSFGNGSAMRVAPVGWAFENMDDVLSEAKRCAEVTHNHPEGIKGAQAIAAAIFLARTGKKKEEIKDNLEKRFKYDLSRSVNQVREQATWDETCIRSVPEAIICFLDSISFEDSIRNAISLGADADTQACIAGSIAEAYYMKIPTEFKSIAKEKLNKEFILLIRQFRSKYNINL